MHDGILQDRIKEVVTAVLLGKGAEIVEINYSRQAHSKVLRILADKPAGITVDECAEINRIIREALDKEGLIDESYMLEVSSPGLDRPLKTKNDFLRLKGKGKKICAHTYEIIDGKKEFRGAIEEVGSNFIVVSDEKAGLVNIPLDKISKARLDYKGLF